MYPEIMNYFNAERMGGWLALVIGFACLAFAVYLWVTRSTFLHMAWPVLVFGLLAVFAGGFLVARTPGQMADLEHGLRHSKTQTVTAEIERMEKVNSNFRLLKYGEAGIMVAGLGLVFLFPIGSALSSIGLGLIPMAALALVVDTFAHLRAEVYVNWLETLVA